MILSLIQTYFSPDEHWQILEVAIASLWIIKKKRKHQINKRISNENRKNEIINFPKVRHPHITQQLIKAASSFIIYFTAARPTQYWCEIE
ncbi:hypothetical protein FRX31_017485 [Thalictrum thalictroides]|uniref:Uncharacterized protein n=1 Tax=Thalictrum thalictroides TaxID=46969 RepID=A0A7J6W7X4_THATH|nr:hypothetical protein FRX31_017485 [Thalictrum thalictroides]